MLRSTGLSVSYVRVTMCVWERFYIHFWRNQVKFIFSLPSSFNTSVWILIFCTVFSISKQKHFNVSQFLRAHIAKHIPANRKAIHRGKWGHYNHSGTYCHHLCRRHSDDKRPSRLQTDWAFTHFWKFSVTNQCRVDLAPKRSCSGHTGF